MTRSGDGIAYEWPRICSETWTRTRCSVSAATAGTNARRIANKIIVRIRMGCLNWRESTSEKKAGQPGAGRRHRRLIPRRQVPCGNHSTFRPKRSECAYFRNSTLIGSPRNEGSALRLYVITTGTSGWTGPQAIVLFTSVVKLTKSILEGSSL